MSALLAARRYSAGQSQEQGTAPLDLFNVVRLATRTACACLPDNTHSSCQRYRAENTSFGGCSSSILQQTDSALTSSWESSGILQEHCARIHCQAWTNQCLERWHKPALPACFLFLGEEVHVRCRQQSLLMKRLF
eukprot:5174878-Pleurochrysis_carterae.AAC.4